MEISLCAEFASYIYVCVYGPSEGFCLQASTWDWLAACRICEQPTVESELRVAFWPTSADLGASKERTPPYMVRRCSAPPPPPPHGHCLPARPWCCCGGAAAAAGGGDTSGGSMILAFLKPPCWVNLKPD